MSKPRLAETADELLAKIKDLSGGVVHEGRILYPVVRMVCGGGLYRISKNGYVERVASPTCSTVRYATFIEMEDLYNDLDKDRVEVVIYSQWGYASEYRNPKVIKVLHSPSGNAFQ